MRKSGLLVSIAALMSGVFSATAAVQGHASPPLKIADAAKQAAPAGNPLWAIPLGDLPQTNARPLFSPSRRPPAPPVYALASAPAKPVPPRKPGPDHPLVTLLGTIVSRSMEIGVFVAEGSHDVIRLKAGDVHDGWTLTSVVDRAAFFQKDGYRAATLALAAPSAESTASSGGTNLPTMAPVGRMTGVAPANTVEPPR